VVTFSKKVFIPLTRLCQDRCHYCTFATVPHRLPACGSSSSAPSSLLPRNTTWTLTLIEKKSKVIHGPLALQTLIHVWFS